VFADSIPGLRALLNQGAAAIGSCQADVAGCEQRSVNAEGRAATAELKLVNAEARVLENYSLWRIADSTAVEERKQSSIWERRAYPSLWEQVQQIPRKAVTSSALVSLGYLACEVRR
jgi:hypothetical protein